MTVVDDLPLGRQARARQRLREAGFSGVMSADPALVTWLSGDPVAARYVDNPFSMRPVVVLTEDWVYVVVSEDCHVSTDRCEVICYPGYSMGPLLRWDNFVSALRRIPGWDRVGVDGESLPLGLKWLVDLQDIPPGLLDPVRAVKDPDEIEALEHALSVSAAGQATVSAIVAGSTELEAWGQVRTAMENRAGAPLRVVADFLSGDRTALVEGPATTRVLRRGDLLLADLVPQVDGYWGDTCTTVALGEEIGHVSYGEVRSRLLDAIAYIRPGMLVGRLDEMMRHGLDYRHHSGHGLGTSFHEEPRVVPGSEYVLTPGMVLALEVGAYGEGYGIRLEHVVKVTADGCKLLSTHTFAE